ncbi:MAG TPA: glucoamylase family protein, partial [Polyangiales bacterium]
MIGILLLSTVIASYSDLTEKPADVRYSQHLVAVGLSARRHLLQALLALAFLPFEAFFCLDAIVRTIGRMLITRRRLLEWSTSSEVDRALEQADRTDLLASYRSMAIAPGIAVAACIAVSLINPVGLALAGPILLLWGASPAIAWWVSRPIARRRAKLTLDETHFLRKLARKTWAYFETHVGPDDHWLPPDNVQEQPVAKVAHRTSPTNMGLALLANLTAHDFGYLSTGQLVARTTHALRTMESLERHRGHFYNWYDTQALSPLAPRYVSTVDSGNLAAHLLTLRPGLAALVDAPILNRRWLEGLSDTFSILIDILDQHRPAAVLEFEAALESAIAARPVRLTDAWVQLERLAAGANDAAAHFAANDSESEAGFWANALARQCSDFRDELVFLAPWLELQPVPSMEPGVPGDDGIPALRELATRKVPNNDPTAQNPALPEKVQLLVNQGAERSTARMAAIDALVEHATALGAMDYEFLYDKVRRQLVIGYNVTEHRCDSSYYDLLASEARLCSFVAIAQGRLPQESWFALGRTLTTVGGEPVLLSWSGSMFEYLMPLLVMPTYENTLLDETYVAAVDRQIEYGRQRGVPWGISESGYNTVDVQLNYQYRAFGVPGLGLKRGLGEDLVVAPYASALALMVAPEAACLNL